MIPIRLLVVDDEETLLGALRGLFEIEGHEVLTAATLAQARSLLSREPDVVLLDLKLPDGSGLGFIREGKAASAETEFILMTAYSSLPTAVEALDAGAHSYLMKPFENLTVVRDRVTRAAALGAGRRANTRLIADLRRSNEELSKARVEIGMINEILAEKVQRAVSSEREVKQLALDALKRLMVFVASLDRKIQALFPEKSQSTALLSQEVETEVQRIDQTIQAIEAREPVSLHVRMPKEGAKP